MNLHINYKYFQIMMYVHLVAILCWIPLLSAFIRPPNGGRIIGGSPARAGEFPFAAAISVRTRTGQIFCGGSIITPKHILTSGDCVDGGVEFTVRVGSNKLDGDDRYRTTVATNDYILHPDYNPTTLENNLGFVVLRMNLTLIVGYLWYVPYFPTEDVGAGESAITLGWGQVNDDIAGPENDLHYVQVATLSNQECKLTYGDQITDDMVCVEGNYNEGTCIGDSGAPLVQNVRIGLMKQVAVASFMSGNGCESLDPSGFTRIYPAMDWIKSVTGITA